MFLRKLLLGMCLLGCSSGFAGEFDKPFFISLTGDWSGSGTLKAGDRAIPITPARIRAETKDNGTFTLEGDITVGEDLGFYSMTFVENSGAISVTYANSDGSSASLSAFVDYAAKTAKITGPEREFVLSLGDDLLKVELIRSGASPSTALLTMKRE